MSSAEIPIDGSGESAGARERPESRGGSSGILVLAALASIGAGAVHSAAVGSHGDLPQVALTFTILAIAQIGWGVAVLVAPTSKPLLWLGLLLNLGALQGWIAAKTVGIPFIDGFETAESVQRADGLAALLAVVSVLATAVAVVRPAVSTQARLGMAPLLAAALVGAITVPAMAATTDHAHSGHGADEHAAGDGHHDGDDDHAHDDDADEHSDHDEGDGDGAGEGTGDGVEGGDDHSDHVAAAVAPVPYDPAMPIDLGGVEGVTPQQQARAENLIAITLDRLPKYADPTVAEADGFHSIGDGFTGHEHYINWDYLQDGNILNPDYPESLVYEQRGGKKTLVSAMFMLERGESWEEVPDIGGPLTQWHIHDDLCFSSDPIAPKVSGITSVGGSCQPPLQKLEPLPMIHVWIVPHECGPFAALSGVGAGQIQDGETRLCDTAHGGH